MPDYPKLYLDENVHKQVASSLRLRGYSVISAHEKGNWGLPDREQLEVAITRESAIFTFDPRDFILLHKEYTQEGKDHYGIIVSDQITIGKTVKGLSNLLLDRSSKELESQLLWL